MKKSIILAAACFIFASATCQKTATGVISGRWTAYSLTTKDISINTEKLEDAQRARIKAATALAPNHFLTIEDSVTIMENTATWGRKIDSSYVEFAANGKYTALICFGEAAPGGQKRTGTYKRAGSDKVILELSDGTTETLVIKELTGDHLSIAGSSKKAAESYLVKFKKQ